MTDKKEHFHEDIKKLQTILAEIKKLEAIKQDRIDHLNVETGKILENSNKQIQQISIKISLLKQKYQNMGNRIASYAVLVAIDPTEDTYLNSKALQNPDLQNGIETIPLYGSLRYFTIFDGPANLPVQDKWTLNRWDQYEKAMVSSKVEEQPKINQLKSNLFI